VCRACAFDFLGGDGEAQVFCSNGDSHYELCLLPVEIECVCLFNVACVLLLVMVVAWQVVRFCAVLLILGHAQVAAAALMRGASKGAAAENDEKEERNIHSNIDRNTKKRLPTQFTVGDSSLFLSLSL